jgi:hypothetical protein
MNNTELHFTSFGVTNNPFASEIRMLKYGTPFKDIRNGKVYRFEDGIKRWYPNAEIAKSWDNAWETKIVNISFGAIDSIPTGADMALKPGSSNPAIKINYSNTENQTTQSSGASNDKSGTSEKFLGIKKPTAYFVYSGIAIIVIVVLFLVIKK